MRYVIWDACFLGGVLVTYGLLQDNLAAVVIGAFAAVACASLEVWSKTSGRSLV